MVNKVAGVVEPTVSTNLTKYTGTSERYNKADVLKEVNKATDSSTRWEYLAGLKKNFGFDDYMSHNIEDETLTNVNEFYATKVAHPLVEPPMDKLEQLINHKEHSLPYKTLSDYYEAYRSKSITPMQVCTKLIELMNSEQIKNINAVIEVHNDDIMQAAKESTERFEKKVPLSVIDGVPFFVKDQLDIAGYHLHFGCSNLMDKHCVATCTVIKRLLDAGAILIGTTNMTFLGVNIIGYNPSKIHGHVKNPYNTDHYCGGSSNGSAAVVSCGLVPFSIGVDGLGSNRVPPAFTGIVGMRGTIFRVSNGGTAYEPNTAVIIGPMATNVRDEEIIYGIMAGPDDLHPSSLYQPSVILPTLNESITNLISKIKIGYDSSLTHIALDKSIVRAVESTINRLKSLGFSVVNYCVSEISEITGATRAFSFRDFANDIVKELGVESANTKFECANATLLNILGNNITDEEYEKALRQRRRAQLVVKDMFSKFDVFITPMSGLLAPKIVQGDDEHGVMDRKTTLGITPYIALSSATGIPALSLQIDTTTDTNLPIGIQLHASWWKEDLLFELGHIIESFLPPEKRSPKVVVSPL